MSAIGWACDFEDHGLTYVYRERIANVQPGEVIKCCESEIVIPEGQPYADCRVGWFEVAPTAITRYLEETQPDFDEDETVDYDELPIEVLLPHLDFFPQCIEVWRKLRNDSHKRHYCPEWGDALHDYREALYNSGHQSARLALISLETTIRRARVRYEAGGGPTLNVNERGSLESGGYVWPIKFGRAK